MKTSSLVLAASVAANVILLGLIAIDVARPPIAPAEPAPPAAAPTPAKAPPAQTWATLTDADLAKQIELLRAEDFPPAIIRAIVGAQVRERFAARRKPLEAALANTPFWLRSRPDPATQAALRALAREEQAAVEALLGPDLENGAIASLRARNPMK